MSKSMKYFKHDEEQNAKYREKRIAYNTNLIDDYNIMLLDDMHLNNLTFAQIEAIKQKIAALRHENFILRD